MQDAKGSPSQVEESSLTSSTGVSSSSVSWRAGQEQLKDSLDQHIYHAYIQPLKFDSYDTERSELRLTAPSRLVCNHVDSHLRIEIEKAAASSFGSGEVHLKLFVSDSAPQGSLAHGEHTTSQSDSNTQEPLNSSRNYAVVKKVKSSPGGGTQQKLADKNFLNPKYTFSSYVVGNNNQFCHAASNHVAEQPGIAYNPLFIYGGVGLGKTHLLHAIGNATLLRDKTKKVLYMSSETFTNELILALRFAKMDEFKNRLRNIDVLLIDDIQFMCGKERTQEEFFHTFNALYSAKHQIVITSDKIPQEIPGIEERLRTRFAWGLTADIQAPDFETRVAILKRKAALDACIIPEEVAHYIAEKISSNVRELEGALTRLHAQSSLQRIPITMELATSALKPLLTRKKVNIGIPDIQRVVSEYFGIKVSEMISKRRTKNLSFPRHVAMYLCRKHTTASYPEIGSKFGGRDHSSVIHAANVVANKLKDSAELKAQMVEIDQILTEP